MAVATYSSNPFISHDAVSPTDRAEVKVVTGYGNIFDVELSDKGNSTNVTFKVDNSKFKSNGWAPTGGNVLTKVEEARDAGVPIHFRIEVRRKDHVDRTIPINEISTLAMAKDNVVKSLAAVKIEGEDEWTISPYAKTRMDEDPRSGSGAGGSANDFSAEDLGIGVSKVSANPETGNKGYSSKNNSFEAPPFATYNYDDTLNVGSAAVAVPSNLYSFVVEYERNNESLGTLTDKNRILLSKVLLAASNELQVEIYEGKLTKPDLSLGSHTRARALIFETIRTFLPLTSEIVADKAKLKEWKVDIVAKSLAMWKWSIAEVKKIEEID